MEPQKMMDNDMIIVDVICGMNNIIKLQTEMTETIGKMFDCIEMYEWHKPDIKEA